MKEIDNNFIRNTQDFEKPSITFRNVTKELPFEIKEEFIVKKINSCP